MNMKKDFILYIKKFGLKLWIMQMMIMVFNKLNIFEKYKNKLRFQKNKVINKWLLKNYKDLIEKYKNLKEDLNKNYSNNIWIFWWQGLETAPEIVKASIESVRHNCPNYKINIITEENINDYYKIPQNILNKLQNKTITLTHLSDIIRMNLLNNYGGFWIDATIYLTKNPFIEKTFKNYYTIKFDAENDKTSISRGKWCGFFQGGSNPLYYKFMVEFFNTYWENEPIMIDYFLIDYAIELAYQNFPEVKKSFDSVPYNNLNIHELQSLLNETFDIKNFNKLKSVNDVHKLSYKLPIKDIYNTYYSYVIKNNKK